MSTTTATLKKIELRRITYNSRLSHETSAYAAEVWVDGVHVCDASNDGHGGPDFFDPHGRHTGEDVRLLEQHVREHFPKETLNLGGEVSVLDADLESVCGNLLTAWLVRRDLEQLLKRTIAFKAADGKSGVSYIKGRLDAAGKVKAREQVLRKHPGAVVLNDLPFDEALSIFSADVAA